MQYNVYSLLLCILHVQSLLFTFKMGTGKCSRKSHLEHLKYTKTIRRTTMGELTALLQSPDPLADGEGAFCSLSKNPTPLRTFGHQAATLRALATPFPLIPHYLITSDAIDYVFYVKDVVIILYACLVFYCIAASWL